MRNFLNFIRGRNELESIRLPWKSSFDSNDQRIEYISRKRAGRISEFKAYASSISKSGYYIGCSESDGTYAFSFVANSFAEAESMIEEIKDFLSNWANFKPIKVVVRNFSNKPLKPVKI